MKQSIWIAAALLLAACAPPPILEGVIGVDATPPTFLSARMPTTTRLAVRFSEPVAVRAVRVDPELPVQAAGDGAAEVSIDFARAAECGRRYVLDIEAEDADGNTVTALAPFLGRNDDPPAVLINEIRTEYSKPKAEFVELRALEAGNLGGLSLATTVAGFGAPVFTFPPLAVAAGEFVVVHLRSAEEGLADETGALDASSGTDSSPAARDFWVPGNEKRVRKTDVVALLDTEGEPLDGVAFTETPGIEWKNEALREAAAFLSLRGAWTGEAASSVGSAATRTLCRGPGAADSGAARDWRIVATGGASPGAPNAATVYVPAEMKLRRGP